MKRALCLILLASYAISSGCDKDSSSFGLDAGPHDTEPSWDGGLSAADGRVDIRPSDGPRVDRPAHDASRIDSLARDASRIDATGDSRGDMLAHDATRIDGRVDSLAHDATRVDMLARDATHIDATRIDATGDSGPPPPPGLSMPCQLGPGWTLFRFHYDSGSTSARVDVWDASCSYSLAYNSACNVRTVYPGFGDVDTTSQGYPILTTSEYLRVRFSVAGLSFSNAAVYVQARSYATASSTYYRVWSPLYGEQEGGPVDNDWTYDWYGLDWSNYLSPADQPSLTAIQIYAAGGSGKLAVRAVELCVQ